MKALKYLVLAFWYGLGLYLALTYLQGPLGRSWFAAHDFFTWLSFAKALVGLLVLIAFFVTIHFLVREENAALAANAAQHPAPGPQQPGQGESYPSRTTIRVGVWILLLTSALVLGLFFVIVAPFWPDWLKEKLFWQDKSPDFTNMLVMMFSAGIGSMITAILGYLKHASESEPPDFKQRFVPWYVGRPLMGSLLGMIFYFLLRGGMLATLQANGKQIEGKDLSVWALAGIGSMIGMFSKNAIEKLQEVFNTLFAPNPANQGQQGGQRQGQQNQQGQAQQQQGQQQPVQQQPQTQQPPPQNPAGGGGGNR